MHSSNYSRSLKDDSHLLTRLKEDVAQHYRNYLHWYDKMEHPIRGTNPPVSHSGILFAYSRSQRTTAAYSTAHALNHSEYQSAPYSSSTGGLHAGTHHKWRAKPANGSAMVSAPHIDGKGPSSQTSLVLPLANSPGGHRLGVNGLAIDVDRSIL